MNLFVFLWLAAQVHLSAQVVAVAGGPSQDQSQERLVTVVGKVLHASGGAPVPKVTLTLRSEGSTQASKYVAVSGLDGAFLIDRVEPGTYSLYAEKRGFLTQQYGSRRPGGRGIPLTLPEGTELKDVVLKVTPQGIVSGKVTDEAGEPLDKMSVVLMRWGYSQGKRVLVIAGGCFVNDLGEYRIANISPGNYYLAARRNLTSTGFSVMRADIPSATLPETAEEGYQTTYYPSSLNPAEAATVQVAAGADIGGKDIRLRKARVFRVRGQVEDGATGRPVAEARVALVPDQPRSILGMSSFGGKPIPGGEFEINGVLPGSYDLVAEVRQGGHTLYARQWVTVTDHNVTGIIVRIPVPVDVRGRVRLYEREPQPSVSSFQQNFPLERLRIVLLTVERLGVGIPEARVHADGSFLLSGIVPDRFRISLSGVPASWYVKSIHVAGTECPGSVADLPGGDVEIVLSMGTAKLTGTVRDEDGKTVPGAVVALVSEGTSGLQRTAKSDQNGAFVVRDLAPGAYRVLAWEDLDSEWAFDPELRRHFDSKAMDVRLVENGHDILELKAIPTEEVAKVFW